MRLNTLKPAKGAKKPRTRVGRGCGSGMGKTCGLGHKGQHARSGGYHKVGFEGGQAPLQRRIPKFGFTSLAASQCAEVRLHELNKIKANPVDLAALRAANIITAHITRVKVIASGKLEKPVTLVGIAATRGARAAIEALGGKVEN